VASVGVRELKANASQIIERSARGEPFIVTRRGKAVSVLLPFDVELEDLVLAEAREFVRMRERARGEHKAGRTVSLKDLERKIARPRARVVSRRAR
jgi:prevent-host-death family protein